MQNTHHKFCAPRSYCNRKVTAPQRYEFMKVKIEDHYKMRWYHGEASALCSGLFIFQIKENYQ